MASQATSRLTKLRWLESTLWQLGFYSLAFTVPIGAAAGYSAGGTGEMLIGLTIAFAFSGVILLVALLMTWVVSRAERRA
jgi:hypothetical protein